MGHDRVLVIELEDEGRYGASAVRHDGGTVHDSHLVALLPGFGALAEQRLVEDDDRRGGRPRQVHPGLVPILPDESQLFGYLHPRPLPLALLDGRAYAVPRGSSKARWLAYTPGMPPCPSCGQLNPARA